VTTTEPSLSAGRSETPTPGRRRMPRTGPWLPTWDLITTKNLEIRKRRGLMITMVVLIIVPTVLFYGLRLLFHAVDPHGYGLAGSPQFFSQSTNLIDEFGFIAAAALGAAAGTTDLSDGMFRHLVITGRSRLALYLARIPAGLAQSTYQTQIRCKDVRKPFPQVSPLAEGAVQIAATACIVHGCQPSLHRRVRFL